jgi:uncharacterized protein (TIRG00374 family)
MDPPVSDSLDRTKNQKRNRILSWVINLIGLGFFALILYIGGIEAWRVIAQADWRYVLAAFVATVLWNLVATYRWALIANQVIQFQEPCPFRYYFTYQMIGMLAGQVLPITVGMLGGRPVALSLSRGVSLKRSALSVFLDKLFDLILAVLLVLPVALFLVDAFSVYVAFGLMASVVIIGAFVIGLRYGATMRVVGRVGTRLSQPLGHVPVIGQKFARRLPQQLDQVTNRNVLPNRVAIQAFLLTVLMYALLSARLIYIANALRLEIPWYLLVMGVSVTQLALVFSVTPGSLGFLEGGWGAVLGLAGLSLEQFTFFVIGRRAFVLVFTLINTLLAFAWIRESPAHLFREVIAASRGGDRGSDRGSEGQPEPGSQIAS